MRLVFGLFPNFLEILVKLREMQVKEEEKYSWQTVEIKRRRIIGQSDRIER